MCLFVFIRVEQKALKTDKLSTQFAIQLQLLKAQWIKKKKYTLSPAEKIIFTAWREPMQEKGIFLL